MDNNPSHPATQPAAPVLWASANERDTRRRLHFISVMDGGPAKPVLCGGAGGGLIIIKGGGNGAPIQRGDLDSWADCVFNTGEPATVFSVMKHLLNAGPGDGGPVMNCCSPAGALYCAVKGTHAHTQVYINIHTHTHTHTITHTS